MVINMFKRKAYEQLKEWKEKYGPKYACLVEGARRIGKTTLVEEFAKNEYETYIKIDFSELSNNMRKILEDINNRDLFFLELQNEMNINLINRKSCIIFDEIQLYPKARQAIKHLVKDGRYDYIETGSLISIKKNVKDILIPSEEHKIEMFPLDYEEFLWAIGQTSDVINKIVDYSKPLGESSNRVSQKRFRLYMAIGGMPQAIEAYLKTNNFNEVDKVKREIVDLYKSDIKKIDPTGRMSAIFESIPSQLALKKNKFVISNATKKRRTNKDDERIYELIDSKIVLPCFNVTDINLSLEQSKDISTFKLYLLDTGLFVTMIFNSGNKEDELIYKKLLADKLETNLGYLYENAIAQILTSLNKKLYYHMWNKENSTHKYEIDFLIISNNKIVPIEVKSSSSASHGSILNFQEKYSHYVGRRILFYQKDFSNEEMLELIPIYTSEFVLKRM